MAQSSERELASLPAIDLAARIRGREVSPVEVTRTFLERIERLDPSINAFVTVTGDLAMARAAEAERQLLGDTSTDTLIAEYATGPNEARTHAVWVTKNGKLLLVTNTAVNTVAALDASTGEILWSLPVGSNPSEVITSANGRIAYVSVRGEDVVRVIDVESRAIIGEVRVGDQPDTLQLTPDGKTLVVALRGTPATITLVDTVSLTASQIVMPFTTTGHNAISANGHYSFVAVEGPGGIVVVDHATGMVVATYPYPGGGRPHGIFYEPSRFGRAGD